MTTTTKTATASATAKSKILDSAVGVPDWGVPDWATRVSRCIDRLKDAAGTADGQDAKGAEPDETEIRDRLGELLVAIASNPGSVIDHRGWDLARWAERAATDCLRSHGKLDTPGNSRVPSLAHHAELASEAWSRFRNPPEAEERIVTRVESVAELTGLPGMTNQQICKIFEDADPTDDESKFGPWLSDNGPFAAGNYERLRAVRRGEAMAPTTRTRIARPGNWPAKMPLLLMLRQLVAFLGE